MALIPASTMSYTTWAVPTLTAASASDTFAMPSTPGQYFIVYRNTNATARSVTVDLPTAYTDPFGRSISDMTGTGASNLIGTTGELWIPIHPAMADTTGLITVTVSPAVTNVTVGVVRIA